MTVAELRKKLEEFPDEAVVVAPYTSGVLRPLQEMIEVVYSPVDHTFSVSHPVDNGVPAVLFAAYED